MSREARQKHQRALSRGLRPERRRWDGIRITDTKRQNGGGIERYRCIYSTAVAKNDERIACQDTKDVKHRRET